MTTHILNWFVQGWCYFRKPWSKNFPNFKLYFQFFWGCSLFFTEPIHKFTEVLKDSQADEKSSVTLQCETAQSPSTVIWLKGHTELKAGGRYEMSQKERVLTLTIKQLEEKDTDIYTCDVITAKNMAKVTVKGKNFIQVCLA